MQADTSSLTPLLSDVDARDALMAFAERAGEVGAKRAVKDSFFLVGIDLDDRQNVDDFRAGIRRVVLSEKRTNERRTQFRGSLIGAAVSLLSMVIVSVTTTFIAFAMHTPPGVILPH